MSSTLSGTELNDLIAHFTQTDTDQKYDTPSITDWIRRGFERDDIKLPQHPRLALFAAAHSHETYNEYDSGEFAKSYMQKLLENETPVNELCALYDCDLRVYDLGLEQGPQAAALDTITQAMAYGMMAVEPGVDLMILGAFGPGSITNTHKSMEKALSNDILGHFVTHAAHELAAMTGAVIAARLAKIPVILDGVQGRAVYQSIKAANPFLTKHCALTDGLENSPDFNLSTDLSRPAIAFPGLTGAQAVGQLRNILIPAQDKYKSLAAE